MLHHRIRPAHSRLYLRLRIPDAVVAPAAHPDVARRERHRLHPGRKPDAIAASSRRAPGRNPNAAGQNNSQITAAPGTPGSRFYFKQTEKRRKSGVRSGGLQPSIFARPHARNPTNLRRDHQEEIKEKPEIALEEKANEALQNEPRFKLMHFRAGQCGPPSPFGGSPRIYSGRSTLVLR